MTEKNTSFVTTAITGVIGLLVGGFGAGVYYNSGGNSAVSTSAVSTAESKPLTNDQQKQSYSLGVLMGTQVEPALAFNKDKVQTEYFLQGFTDKISKKDVQLTDEQVRENLKKLQESAASKMKTDLEQKALAKQKDLFTNTDIPFSGKGEIAIVEFFDYNCPHCKEVNTDLIKLVNDNADVKVLYRPVGIVTRSSQTAALAVLAANKQNKFKEFHNALMSTEGEVTEKVLDKIINDLKLDKKKFEKDIVSEEVTKQAQQNRKVFVDLGLRGVPSLFAARLTADNAVDDKGLIYLSGANNQALSEALDKLKK